MTLTVLKKTYRCSLFHSTQRNLKILKKDTNFPLLRGELGVCFIKKISFLRFFTNKNILRYFFSCTMSLFIICLFNNLSTAQDIHFSQYNMSPLIVNPALAGNEQDIRFNINYRDQWKNINAPYKTFASSADLRLKSKRKSAGKWIGGIQFFSDEAGDAKMRTLYGKLITGYQIKLGKKSNLSAAISGGFGQRSIRFDQLQWGAQYDGKNYDANQPTGETTLGQSNGFLDFGLGAVYTYRSDQQHMTSNNAFSFQAGVSVDHIAKPAYSFNAFSEDRLSRKWMLFANSSLGLMNSNIDLQPAIYFIKQGISEELILGTKINYTLTESSNITGYIKEMSLALGAFYRNKDAIILHTVFNWNKYTIGLNYDINVSELSSTTNRTGGLELALQFVLPDSQRK